MSCEHKHAKWDVPEEHWRCPKCGALDDFYIDESVNDECDMLHDADFCRCHKCGYEGTGRMVSKELAKQTKVAISASIEVDINIWIMKHNIVLTEEAKTDLLKIIKPS